MVNLHDFIVKSPRWYHLSQQLLSGNKRILKKIIRKELVGLSTPPRSVLDLGCGTGLLSEVFSDEIYIGVDIDPVYIQLAGQKYPGKKFSVSEGQKLDFPDDNFDFVLLSCTLHHTDDETFKKVLSEVRRVLKKPNGRCLLIDNIQPVKKNFLSSWYANRDEGDFIRNFADYRRLVEESGIIHREYILSDYPLGLIKFIPSSLCVFIIS